MKILTIFLLACINLSVNAQWSSNNALNNAICNYAANQMTVQVSSDGSGGAIIEWYAQKLKATGTVQWSTGGVAICATA